jgi:hypothetical protein
MVAMTSMFVVAALVAAVVSATIAGELAVQIWSGSGAYAKQSNSCYRSCRNQNWPSQHCRGRP